MRDLLGITKPLLGLFIVASSINQLEETTTYITPGKADWPVVLTLGHTSDSPGVLAGLTPPRFLDTQVRGGAWKPAFLTRSQVMAGAAGQGHALRTPGVVPSLNRACTPASPGELTSP